MIYVNVTVHVKEAFLDWAAALNCMKPTTSALGSKSECRASARRFAD